ncbi:MAG: glycosyltransferase family 2 protein [Putridiphycobacter sp.]|nr:glycosyltransferase family 2 protein [Putridiphycobacter sp.]
MAFIFIYSLVQLSLVINYRKSKKKATVKPANPSVWPHVTVQLPVYNELYVIEELIDAVCNFEYPKDKLEIQVLDDSNDETVALIARKVKHYADQNIDIKHVRRPERIGYKAGALKYGTAICKGEYIAIFDSDFKPTPRFLKETIPYFNKPEIGVVQSKWGYTNPNYSFLTQLQAFGLNAHFSIEQVGRGYNNHFINFNGTAGVWRKACIEDAGGWESDTLTEDLDLSYRAQLKNWEFIYLEHVVSPSELPIEINSLKAQQYRWTKGASECFSKNFKRVLFSKNTKLSTKIHALFHLLNSTVFLIIFAMALLSLPVIYAKNELGNHLIIQLSSIFMLSWLILGVFYYTSFKENSNKSIGTFFINFICFLAVSMGLSLHNAVAVAEGYIGRKTPFVRTPKFNVSKNESNGIGNIYSVKKLSPITYMEGVMILYFLFTLKVAVYSGDYAMIPFVVFLLFGYGFVFFSSFIHLNRPFKNRIAYEKMA